MLCLKGEEEFALEIISISEGEVVVPYRARDDLPAAILVEVAAQSVAVDLLVDLDPDVGVDERLHVEVGSVAGGRASKADIAVEGGFEAFHVLEQPILLGTRRQIRFDDLRPGHRRSFGFTDPVDVAVARSVDEVGAVVAAAERHADAGRWVAGFLSYEAAPAFDPVLVTHDPADGFPLAWFAAFDERRLDPPWPEPIPYELGQWEPDQDRSTHAAALGAIHRFIGAGDTYQVNYTLRMRGRFSGDPLSAYADLIAAQSGGFGAFLDLGSFQVLSASPELFFYWDEEGITTRPMKGTVGRGRWPAEDEARRLWLAESEKDRAENLMIVDLLRNDLGRIAEYGSVEVGDLFGTERFDTLWQMTSTVRAVPRSGISLLQVLRALFPSGSVTGAPKARTMEIIRELEATPRRLYCGAVGLLAPPGSGEANRAGQNFCHWR